MQIALQRNLPRQSGMAVFSENQRAMAVFTQRLVGRGAYVSDDIGLFAQSQSVAGKDFPRRLLSVMRDDHVLQGGRHGFVKNDKRVIRVQKLKRQFADGCDASFVFQVKASLLSKKDECPSFAL